MATTIDIACPKCGNASKAPAELAGKKIRCKQCETVFLVQAAASVAAAVKKAPAQKAPTAKAPANPPPKPAPAKKAEDGPDKNPYVMREENLAARCPHCALTLDPPDSRICLNCGYDMQKRKRVESKKTYERTPMDYFLYHLPTVGCFIAFCVAVAIFVLSFFYAADVMEDSWFQNDDKSYLVKPGIIPLYVALLLGFAVVAPSVRFIVKRLINFTPPEVIKRDEED